MGVFTRALLLHSEHHLATYRRRAEQLDPELLDRYQAMLPTITECYAKAGYWHGTGHYHYHHPHDSRYGDIDTSQIVDVLGAVMQKGGLAAHHDLWFMAEGAPIRTVSLAPSRMHARLYAHIHLEDNVWLPYVFGGTRFWMGFFVAVVASDFWGQFRRGERTFLRQCGFDRRFMTHARTWASAIRNLDQYRFLPLWRAYDLRSDIAGNYPILFGIMRSAVAGDGVVPFLKRVEVRVAGLVPLSQVTHIEVPLAHVEKTRAALPKNLIIPIIPLEFGELYCSNLPLTQLAHV